MTAVWVGAACLAVGLLSGALIVWRPRARWIEVGRRDERQLHGAWSGPQYLMPPVERRRWWAQRNRKEPAPADPAPARPVFYR
jgi:hypothetical protein